MALTTSVPLPQIGSFPVGTDILLIFTMYNPDGNLPQPTNITGWNFGLFFYDYQGNLKFTKTNGSGITITDVVNGVISALIVAADTTGFKQGNYSALLQRTDFGSVTDLAIVNFFLPFPVT